MDFELTKEQEDIKKAAQELCSVTFGAEEILLFGTEEQKRRYLPPLTQGKAIIGP